MTSAELEECLLVEASGQAGEAVPEQDEPPLGRRVVHILRKRRTDLTADDAAVMRAVVDLIRRERDEDLEPVAGDASWRHRLMRVGHDPLAPNASAN